MCGPTGVGILYGKYDLLQETKPTRWGGGSNARYKSCGRIKLKNAPAKFEAGTPNIEGVIGLGAAIEYLIEIGMDNIRDYELELRQYAVKKIHKLIIPAHVSEMDNEVRLQYQKENREVF